MSSAEGINIILRLLIYDPPSSSLTHKIGGEAVPAQCTDTNITMASLCLSQLSTDIQRKLALCNHFLFLAPTGALEEGILCVRACVR